MTAALFAPRMNAAFLYAAITVVWLLFQAESGHWVETRGAPGRQGACQNCCDEQRGADQYVNSRIESTRSVQHRLDQLRYPGAGDESEEQA